VLGLVMSLGALLQMRDGMPGWWPVELFVLGGALLVIGAFASVAVIRHR
jgi:hypothetical protein